MRRRRPSPADERGFTLIEVMVSALMVVLIGTATATALIATTHASANQRRHAEADALVSADQDRMRGLSDEQLSQLGSGVSRTVIVDGFTYTVTSQATYQDSTGAAGCTTSAAAYYRIVSTASWTEAYANADPATSVTSQSLLARPVTGDLLVGNVEDQTGTPLAGVTVTARGPSIQTSVTDGNGCVLFAGLAPGSYTVALTDAGYVDPADDATQTGSASVALSGTAQAKGGPFYFGQAGSVAATFATPRTTLPGQGSGGLPVSAPGESDGLSWQASGGSGTVGAAKTATANMPVASLTAQPLYPNDITAAPAAADYTDNYNIWAGRCLEQEPPVGADQFSVTPGSAQSQPVTEPLLLLDNVVSAQGLPIKPTSVVLTFTSTAGPTCSYSWSPTVAPGVVMPATGWLQNPGQPFASSAATGASASASSRFGNGAETGTLTVCAQYNGSYGSTTTENSSMGVANEVPQITTSQPGSCPVPAPTT